MLSLADVPEHFSQSGAVSQTTDTGNGESGAAGHKADYLAFVLVPVFFLLGLLGVVICHVLKRKGYRCTTQPDGGGEEVEEKACEEDLEQAADLSDTVSENNDTVGRIVHYIMKNEANSDALKAMLHDSIDSDGPPLTPTSPGTPSPPVTPISPGAPPGAAKHTCSHLHTVGGPGGTKDVCSRCSQKKWPLVRRPSARRGHNEVTVLAVGRFRVTKCEKPSRERGTLLITDANGSTPSSPTGAEPKSRTTSESRQDQTDNGDQEKR